MKVSARYAPPSDEPLPEHVQAWVDETNAGRGPGISAIPTFDHEGPKLVIEVQGEDDARRHWAAP